MSFISQTGCCGSNILKGGHVALNLSLQVSLEMLTVNFNVGRKIFFNGEDCERKSL